MILRSFLFIITLCFLDAHANWDNKGSVTLEVRQFEDDEIDETFENQRSLLFKYHGEGEWDSLNAKLSFVGRYDDQDPKRKMVWPEDVYLKKSFFEESSISAGYQIFTYSYMEAFHPLDVTNAKILDVSIVNAQKLGELFIGFETEVNGGDFKFYLLPNPTRPELPGKDSRLNLAEDFNKAHWVGQDGEESDWSDHFLISYEKSYDDFDIMFVTSKGMDRSRLLIGTLDYSTYNGNVFPDNLDLYTPFYYERFFSGFNTVYNFESFQFKSSMAYSFYLAEDEVLIVKAPKEVELKRPHDYGILAFGIEKPFSFDNGLDTIYIVEYQTISVADEDRDSFALQNDLFLAVKLSFNDINSKDLTISAMLDLEKGDQEGFGQIVYSQRFFESWRFEMSYLDYFIPEDAALSGIGIFKDKEHYSLKIKKYF
jgi:hypothetical protein